MANLFKDPIKKKQGGVQKSLTGTMITLDSKKEAWKSGVVPATEARCTVALCVLVRVTVSACAAPSAARPKRSAAGVSRSASAAACDPTAFSSASFPHSCQNQPTDHVQCGVKQTIDKSSSAYTAGHRPPIKCYSKGL